MAIRSPSTGTGAAEQALRVRLRIEPELKVDCPLISASCDGETIEQNLIAVDTETGNRTECRVELTHKNDSQYLARATDETCVCPAFQETDCVSSIDGCREGEFFVSATVPDRDSLRSLIENLQSRGSSVALEQISPLNTEDDASHRLVLDSSDITKKQHEAVTLAVEHGYYDSPRKSDLSELATVLAISESAVSQRLRGAETKLIHELARARNGFGCGLVSDE